MSEEITYDISNLSQTSVVHPTVDDYVFYDGDIDNIAKPWLKEPIFIPTILIYGLTFLVGIIGNGIVVFVILGDKKSRTVTTLFLVSLAIADLLFLGICVPCEMIRYFTTHSIMGEVLCKVSAFSEMLSAVASILNLVAMSLERYIVIVHPMRARSWFTFGHTIIIIVIVWFFSFLLSSPAIPIQGYDLTKWFKNDTRVIVLMCVDNVHDEGRIAYAWYQLCIMFIVPSFIMAFCYSVVVYVLWVSTRQLALMTRHQSSQSSDAESRQRLASTFQDSGKSTSLAGSVYSQRGVISTAAKEHSVAVQEARKQVIRMLITLVVIFLLCWGPKLILQVLIKYKAGYLYAKGAQYGKAFLYLLPYIQSCVNPIVYGFMSSNFRRGLRNACRSYICHNRRAYECFFHRGTRMSEYEMDTKTNGSTTHTMMTTQYSPARGVVKSSLLRRHDVIESETESSANQR
ncbi:cholecystokinin receptor type A-like [Tubulanus polymorphus]|uniref:cholecystokinin receptor type A-like n=1 Tax=Tubulanus polymorphus TaxID=672921 RepID=UPI003DA52745